MPWICQGLGPPSSSQIRNSTKGLSQSHYFLSPLHLFVCLFIYCFPTYSSPNSAHLSAASCNFFQMNTSRFKWNEQNSSLLGDFSSELVMCFPFHSLSLPLSFSLAPVTFSFFSLLIIPLSRAADCRRNPFMLKESQPLVAEIPNFHLSNVKMRHHESRGYIFNLYFIKARIIWKVSKLVQAVFLRPDIEICPVKPQVSMATDWLNPSRVHFAQ